MYAYGISKTTYSHTSYVVGKCKSWRYKLSRRIDMVLKNLFVKLHLITY